MDNMKTIYFVRHGETIENTQRILIGTQPGKLTSTGKAQAQALATYFKHRAIDSIYSSPLQRAYDTAAVISAEIKKGITFMEDLKERDMGNLTGIRREEFTALWNRQKDQLHFRPGDGESYVDIMERVRCVLSFLEKKNQQKIVVVSHGRFLKLLINYVQAWDWCSPVPQDNGCINIINYHAGRFMVETINFVPAIPASSLSAAPFPGAGVSSLLSLKCSRNSPSAPEPGIVSQTPARLLSR